MRYQFIDQYKQKFPSWSCAECLRSRKVAITRGASALEARVNEKMLRLRTRFDRPFMSIKADMGAHVDYRELRDDGISCSRKRIARLMRDADLSANRKRRRVITTRRDLTHPVASNLLDRDFHAEEPNKKWVTDVRP